MNSKVLIYGANGYTGKLLCRSLLDRGIKPILAGRSAKVEALAHKHQCEARVFTVDQATEQLSDIDILINLAGPFARTQADLIRACLNTHTHYLDIAGEVPEMESAYVFAQAAKEAGITVVPGAGFGVVPTDIAAHLAAARIPDADQLLIAYATEGEASRGTLKTVLKDINRPGVIIREGETVKALPAQDNLDFKVGNKSFRGVYNPWRADLFTAQRSTGIRNIATYTVFPGFVVSMMKGRMLWLRNLILKYLLNWFPEGPNARQLAKGKTFIYARASKAEQDSTVTIEGPEAYVFTIECLYQLLNILSLADAPRGVLPPSVFGAAVIENIEGVTITYVN